MGQLDEARFEAVVRDGCAACKAPVVEIRSYLDRHVVVMLGEPNDAGRWAHDGEKFVDGVYHVACVACGRVVFSDDACPRCHTAGGLERALAETSRLAVPKRCATCNELELLTLAFVPASARHGGGEPPKPKPLAEFGDPGYHVIAYACDSCDAAVVTQRCPLCDAPGPLRPRP